jgi:hypothetical protein
VHLQTDDLAGCPPENRPQGHGQKECSTSRLIDYKGNFLIRIVEPNETFIYDAQNNVKT